MTLTLSGSAGITNPQGSTTNPSIGIGTNTAGIYWPNAAVMGFTVNGAEAMRVDQQGNVLIGTTTNVTASKLTVRHFGSNNTALAIGDTSSSTGLYFYTTSTANIAVGTGGALTFTTNAGSTEVMRITSTSNLGIGTTSVAAGNAVAIYGGNIQVGTTGTGIKFADGSYQTVAYSGTVNGTAKAFVNFGYVAAAIVINGSYNVSSVTRTGAGTYTVAFTSALSSATYTTVFSQVGTNGSGPYNSGFFFGYQTGALTDQTTTTLLIGNAYAAYNSGGTTRQDVGAMVSVAVFN
jgi:hypothetical protein